MIVGKRFAACYPESIRNAIVANGTTWSLALCGGTIPSDSIMAALTSSSTVITGATLATVNMAGAAFMLVNATTQPPLWELGTLPTTKSANAAVAGTITWAALIGTYTLYLFDVSLPNQGGSVQVDKTVVSVGTPVNLMGISFSIWR